jgi:hypothetical protein
MAAGQGFKIAEAYVDISARMDSRAIKRTIEAGLRDADLRGAGNAAGKEIGDGIDEAVKSKVTGTGKKVSDEFKKSGDDSRRGFGSAFSGIVGVVGSVASTSIKLFSDIFNFRNPALTVGVLALALMTLPVIASAVATAVVLAFGGAFATIGLLAAAQNEEVKRSFSEAWFQIKLLAAGIAEPFVVSMKRMAEEWRGTFESFAPHLQTAFASMAPHIDGFVEGFGVAVRRLIPAIGPVTQAFNVLLDRLAEKMPDLFSAIANSVTDLSNALIRNPGAVDAVINSLIFLIDVVTNITVAFTDFTGWVQDNTGAVAALMIAIANLTNPMLGFIANIIGLEAASNPADAAIVSLDSAVQGAVDAITEANTKTQDWALSLDQLADRNLTTEQAALRFDQSVLKMTDSITKNGQSLDSTTDAGAKNKDSLLSMAEAANKVKDTFIEQGLSQDKVRDKSIQMRDEMVKQAEKLGFTRNEAQALIDKYFAIPDKVETNVSSPGATEAANQIHTVTGRAGGVPRNVDVNVNARDNASGTLGNIISQIGNIARQIWVNVTAIFSGDGNIVGFANGSENHVAQIAGAGAMRVWAEPETGGEAYIPLAPQKRHRSEAILSDVADRFGLTVGRRMADGGVLDSVGMSRTGGKGGIYIGALNVSVSLTGIWDFTNPTAARQIAEKIAPAIREAIRTDERRYQ